MRWLQKLKAGTVWRVNVMQIFILFIHWIHLNWISSNYCWPFFFFGSISSVSIRFTSHVPSLAWRRAKLTWKCLTISETPSVLPLTQIKPTMPLIKALLLHWLEQVEILIRVWSAWSARLFEHFLSGAGIDLQTFFLITAWIFLNRSRSSVVFEFYRYLGVRCAWNRRCKTPMRNGLTPIGAAAFAP